MSSTARGAEPYVLTYAAPAGCPTEEQFRDEVAARVHDASAARGARLAVEIGERDGRFIGAITVTDTGGEVGVRALEGTTCAEVARAAAFFTGLAIDLGGHVEPTPAPPPPAVTPAAPAPPPPSSAPAGPPPSPRSPASPPARSLEFALRAAGGIRSGLATSVRAYGEIGAWIGDARPRVVAPSGGVSLVAARSVLQAASGTAELVLIAGRFDLSPLRLSAGPVELRPCVGLEIGPTFARGVDVTAARSKTTVFAAIEVTGAGRWRVSRRIFFEIAGGAVVPLRHTRYVFLPDVPVYTLPSVAARGALGLGIAF